MLTGFRHHIEDGDELSHVGDHGDFRWLSCCQQPLVLGDAVAASRRLRWVLAALAPRPQGPLNDIGACRHSERDSPRSSN